MPERQKFNPFHGFNEYDNWIGFNCLECARYKFQEDKAYHGCAAEMHLTVACVLGDGDWPSRRTLDFIGITEGAEGEAVMPRLCSGYRDPNQPQPKRIRVIPGQKSLFA